MKVAQQAEVSWKLVKWRHISRYIKPKIISLPTFPIFLHRFRWNSITEKCSHTFLDHFRISWKSVWEKSCFTCRRKWNFCPHFRHHATQLGKIRHGTRPQMCTEPLLSFMKIRTVKNMTYFNTSVRVFTHTHTLRFGWTSVYEIRK